MKQSTAWATVYEPTSDAAPGTEGTHGTPLSNHTDRSGSTVHGLPAIGFGSAFAAVGVTLAVLAALGKIEASTGVPTWLGPFMGVLFAIAGASFIMHGILSVRLQRRTQRLRATHEQQPWVWDHPWDESGSPDDSTRRIGRAAWTAAFVALFLVPFNWVGFLSPDRGGAFAVVAVVMDLVLIALGARVAYLIAQRAKYGLAMLRFRRFPFRPGTEMELHMARPRRLAGVTSPEAVLRCVQERYETRGTGEDRSQAIVAYEVWSDRQRGEFRRGEFVWRFALPAGLPGTALSERPPRYWEVELKVETPGVDFAGTFLVPVYVDGRGR